MRSGSFALVRVVAVTLDPGVLMCIVADLAGGEVHVLQGTHQIHWLNMASEEAVDQCHVIPVARRILLEYPAVDCRVKVIGTTFVIERMILHLPPIAWYCADRNLTHIADDGQCLRYGQFWTSCEQVVNDHVSALA